MNNYSLTAGGVCEKHNIRFGSIILLILFTVACNDSFEPLKENNSYFFSMYGFLDASADPQWVRIAPAREQLEMAPFTPDMRVTLEDTESGEPTVMNDSLSQLRNGVNILNFWTTADIEVGHSYLLKAEQADGATSSATITTPEMAPTLTLIYLDTDSCRIRLNIKNREALADVQEIYEVRIQSGDFKRRRTIPMAATCRWNTIGMVSTAWLDMATAGHSMKRRRIFSMFGSGSRCRNIIRRTTGDIR